MDGYGELQCKHLTKKADDALRQIETKLYCAQMPPHITKLHKYSVFGCLLCGSRARARAESWAGVGDQGELYI
jgi:hypothetical protein